MRSVVDRPRESQWAMIPVDMAMDFIYEHCITPFDEIELATSNCIDHVLSEDVHSTEPHPPFRASIMDGYAVIAADGPGTRLVLGGTTAGQPQFPVFVIPGTCVRVSTGAPIPEGADAVVKVEDTLLVEHKDNEEVRVHFRVAPTAGQDIRPIGCDITVGERVLVKGTRIGSAELGLLSMIGRQQVKVYRKPIITVMSTGNELVDVDASHTIGSLQHGQIRDSNRPQLIALYRQFGYETRDAGIIRDDHNSVVLGLTTALHSCDVLITSGGVSMGEKDLLKTILVDHLHFEIHFARVAMKPGKPTTFATGVIDGRKKFVFALPGNPVSSWVTSHVFVAPALRAMIGVGQASEPEPSAQPTRTTRHTNSTSNIRARVKESVQWPVITVKVQADMPLDPRPEYHRAVFQPPVTGEAIPLAKSTGVNQMSSRLSSAAGANLLLMLPEKSEDRPEVKNGEIVEAMMIGL